MSLRETDVMSVCSVQLSPVDAFVCSPNVWEKKKSTSLCKIKGVAFYHSVIFTFCVEAPPSQKYILFMLLLNCGCINLGGVLKFTTEFLKTIKLKHISLDVFLMNQHCVGKFFQNWHQMCIFSPSFSKRTDASLKSPWSHRANSPWAKYLLLTWILCFAHKSSCVVP